MSSKRQKTDDTGDTGNNDGEDVKKNSNNDEVDGTGANNLMRDFTTTANGTVDSPPNATTGSIEEAYGNNYINGKFIETTEYINVYNPMTEELLGFVGLSNADDVEKAVNAAKDAFPVWSSMTIKARASIMLKYHSLVRKHTKELAELIVQENGKNITEALAEVAKGNETVEYACSLPQLTQGNILRVSSDVTCEDRYVPLGVVASIVPFNFPFMVPMWTIPIALVMGNTCILKPSEKVPFTMKRAIQLMKKAGIPDGVINLIQGTKDAVHAILMSPTVQAVTFVGSSPVANIVATTCHTVNKRCTALGGAKNHLVALADDCEMETAATDITVSFAGCAGQRCMAASVLLLLGSQSQLLLARIIAKSAAIQPGQQPGQMGPVIDLVSHEKIINYINAAEKDGAEILLDGRMWEKNAKRLRTKGYWIGPTIILHKSSDDKTMQEEVFGPVLSVYKCTSWEEAISIENKNPFGNAACIYTSIAAHADWFVSRFRAAMLGCNIGIPVPREPFSFGGLYGTKSKFGDMDITGDGAIEFFSNRIKISSKWPLIRNNVAAAAAVTTMTPSASVTNMKDAANFAGSM